MGILFNPDTPFFDNDTGTPVALGTAYFGEPDQDPKTNAKQPYSDEALTVAISATQSLNSAGKLQQQTFLSGKYSLTVDDADGNQIFSFSSITDTPNTLDPWNLFDEAPVRTSGTTFTVTGDQTSTFEAGTRLKFTDSSTLYGIVTASVFSSLTTVTVRMDSGSLSASLTAVYTCVATVSNPPFTTSVISHYDTSISTSVLYSLESLIIDRPLSIMITGATNDITVDSYTAIYNACVAVGNNTFGGGQVFIPKGNFMMAQTLYLPQSVTLIGVGRRAGPAAVPVEIDGSCLVGAHTGAAVVSAKGTAFTGLKDLCIWGDQTTTPKTGICYGRTVGAGSAGRHYVENVVVGGYFTQAAWYSIASEENTLISPHILLLGGGAKYAFFSSKTDDLSVDSITSGSNWHAGIVESANFINQSETNDSAAVRINIASGTQGWKFVGGFTGMTSGTNSAHVWLHVTEESIYAKDFVFEGLGAESVSNASPPVQHFRVSGSVTAGLRGLRIKHCTPGQTLGGTSFFLKVDDNITLIDPDIEQVDSDYPIDIWKIDGGRINAPQQNINIRSTADDCEMNGRDIVFTNAISTSLARCSTRSPVRGPVTFTGSGVDAMTMPTTNLYSGDKYIDLVVEIDGTGTPNTFQWSTDGGITQEAAGVPITALDQTLTEGIIVLFSQTTGLTSGDKWQANIYPHITPDTQFGGNYSAGNVSNPPTDAELDALFGTPATVGREFSILLEDNGADTNVYHVFSTGTSWFYSTLTKAT